MWHAGLHKLWYPGIQDTSTWSKFGAHGEHGDVFLFSNLGVLWFSENIIRYSLHVCLMEVKNSLFSFRHSYLRHFLGQQLTMGARQTKNAPLSSPKTITLFLLFYNFFNNIYIRILFCLKFIRFISFLSQCLMQNCTSSKFVGNDNEDNIRREKKASS